MPSLVSHDNLRYAVDLVFFEQWIRFYFIVEENGKYFVRMPDCEIATARSLYPELVSVAEALNNREINHNAAVEALRLSMLQGPSALSGEQWAEILEGKDFRLALELLHFWVQADENSLDSDRLPFHDWRCRFEAWRASPGIRDYAARVENGVDIGPLQ